MNDVEDVKSVAFRFGIPHYTFNFTNHFSEKVIQPFISAYESGRTPNPCIDCNRYLKFDVLYHRAKILECEKIATGHYARIENANGRFILITIGSISGLCREIADKLRTKGKKVGVVRLRYLRPFPTAELVESVKNAKAVGVLEKDISFGNEGTVFTNVNSALYGAKLQVPSYNFIGGLGGRNISRSDIENIFSAIENGAERVNFIGIEVE